MSSTKTRRRERAITKRQTSNVFSMFNEAQIQEFKEAFTFIDYTKDGVIDKEDLRYTLDSFGSDTSDNYLEDMLSRTANEINFTMFLTLFGEKMIGCDPEETVLNAFLCFDPERTGEIDAEYFRHVMTSMGDQWDDKQIDELFKHSPIKRGKFNYKVFINMMVHGTEEKK